MKSWVSSATLIALAVVHSTAQAHTSDIDWSKPYIDGSHINEPYFPFFTQWVGLDRHKDADKNFTDGGTGNSDDDGFTASTRLQTTFTSFDQKKQLSFSVTTDILTERYTSYLDDGVIEALFDDQGSGADFERAVLAGEIEGVNPTDYLSYTGRRGGRRIDRIALEVNRARFEKERLLVSVGGGLDLLGDFGFDRAQDQFHYIIAGRHIGDPLDRPFHTELQQQYDHPSFMVHPYADLSVVHYFADPHAALRPKIATHLKLPIGRGEFMAQARFDMRISYLSWLHFRIGSTANLHYMLSERYDFLRPDIWNGFSLGLYQRFEFGRLNRRIAFIEFVTDHVVRDGRYGEPVRMNAGFSMPLGRQAYIEDWKRQ